MRQHTLRRAPDPVAVNRVSERPPVVKQRAELIELGGKSLARPSRMFAGVPEDSHIVSICRT